MIIKLAKLTKRSVLSGVLFFLLIGMALSDQKEIEKISKIVFEIFYINLQIHAVLVESDSWYWYKVNMDNAVEDGYLTEEFRELYSADTLKTRLAREAVEDLYEIKAHFQALDFPEELHHLKDIQTKIINEYILLHQKILNEGSENTDQDYKALEGLFKEVREENDKILEKYFLERLPDTDYDIINEEINLIQDEQDRNEYLKAVTLIKDKKYKQSLDILERLRKKYRNTPFEYCVKYRLSDVLMMISYNSSDDYSTEGVKSSQQMEEEALELLQDILNSNIYLPMLSRVFLRWRTLEQLKHYGMSNFSEIPNEMYNRKRWQIIQLIEDHWHKNLDDKWALKQIFIILNLPNISHSTRSGGNTNMDYYFGLYGGE